MSDNDNNDGILDKYHPGDSAYFLHTDDDEYYRWLEEKMKWYDDIVPDRVVPEFLRVGDIIDKPEKRKLSGKIDAQRFLILSPVRRYKLDYTESWQDPYIWTVEIYSFINNVTGVVELYEAELDDFDIYRDGEKIRSRIV